MDRKRLNSVRADVNGPEHLPEQFNERYTRGDYSDSPEPESAGCDNYAETGEDD